MLLAIPSVATIEPKLIQSGQVTSWTSGPPKLQNYIESVWKMPNGRHIITVYFPRRHD